MGAHTLIASHKPDNIDEMRRLNHEVRKLCIHVYVLILFVTGGMILKDKNGKLRVAWKRMNTVTK